MEHTSLPFYGHTPLYRVRELRTDSSLIPKRRGVYAWFFAQPPGIVPIDGCYVREGLLLLYLGVAGAWDTSKATLRSRIRNNHLQGNERLSTLCETLAALMPEVAGPAIKRREGGDKVVKYHTCNEGRKRLQDWMDDHASICWVVDDQPVTLESDLISQVNTPLNLDSCASSFVGTLKGLRRERRQQALAV